MESAEPAPWTKQATRTGRFERKQSEFRRRIGDEGFEPAAGRYHLYVQYACPWAHRTLLARHILGLEEAITVDVVDWHMGDDGSWTFDPAVPGCTPDSIEPSSSLQEVYLRADPEFHGIGTVPVLWDRQTGTIVNNESREIVRMFDEKMANLGSGQNLLPPGLRRDIDAMIDANYESINNGVYKCGFARSQDAYDEAAQTMQSRLEALNDHMAGRTWLVGPNGGTLTEADICLWPTLVRYDAVYHTHFKCNWAQMRDYPNLWAFTKRLYNLPGVRATVNWDHIRSHYYWSHTSLNPWRIIPPGPDVETQLLA